jgi:hypothetical protein
LLIRRQVGASSERLIGVELDAPHPAVPTDIAIGADVRSVIDALGVPDHQQGEDLVYPLDGEAGESASVTVRIRERRVWAIRWQWRGG